MKKILPAAVFAILLAACSQQTQDSASQAASSVAQDTKANATVVAQEAEAAAQATGNAVENAAETASNAAKNLGASVNEVTANEQSAEAKAPEDQQY